MTASAQRVQQRTVLLVVPDEALCDRLSKHLAAMEWTVLVAKGGAEAIARLHGTTPEAIIVDHWLPDLDADEFIEYVASLCPATDVLQAQGTSSPSTARSIRRNELLHVLRAAVDDTTPVLGRPSIPIEASLSPLAGSRHGHQKSHAPRLHESFGGELPVSAQAVDQGPGAGLEIIDTDDLAPDVTVVSHLPELVGDAPAMRELNQMVRLVAPHAATVLVLGETGTGKELVAKAIHQLSLRAARPFLVLNCAAIPEQLLEAELFGHTRGAFTGAVTSRIGRIEAAHGGTLFLDEIGEMPLALQAKMLRFLESGEVQRVGDNEVSRVDVRIVAATHQPLLAHATENRFRLDLYHRLAVFPIDIAPLRERREDIPMLTQHFLSRPGSTAPRKPVHAGALRRLCHHAWHGNVRELSHVLQRATIMASNAAVITMEHLRMRESGRS